MSDDQRPLVRILHLDDSPADGGLVAHELHSHRYPCRITFVQTPQQYFEALARKDFDLILCDYKLPGFDGDRAFTLAKQSCPEIPFILVTGELGEEFVIERLKQGVTDYILKDNLKRLVPAITRAIEERNNRRARIESETLFRSVLDLAPEAIIIHQDERVVYCNAATVKLYGAATSDQILGKHPLGMIHKDDWPAMSVRMRTVLEGGRTPLQEFRGLRMDGSEIIVELTGAPVPWHGKTAVMVIARDMTERNQAALVLRESEERFRSVLNNSQDIIYRFNLQTGRFEYISPSVETMVGYRPAELMTLDPESILALIHPDDVAAVREGLARAIRNGTAQLEYRQRTKAGDFRWLSNHVTIINDEAGRPLYRDGNSRDITAQKVAEQALTESEERFRFALETSHIGTWEINLPDHTAHRSLEHGRIFGYTEPLPPWSYEKFLDHVLPEDRSMVDSKFRSAAANGGEWSFECRIRRTDGQVRWIWVAGRHYTDEKGEMRRMAGIVHDVTDRKQAETELTWKNSRVYNVLEGITDGFMIVNTDWRITYINPEAARKIGKRPEDAAGKTLWEAWPVSSGTAAEAQYRKAMTERISVIFEYQHTDPGGQTLWLDIHAYPVDEGLVIYQQDITARKSMEERLRWSESIYRAIGETIDYGIWICDKHGRNIYASKSYLDLVGITQEECSEFGWGNTLHPDDAERTIAAWKECSRHGTFWDIEHRFRGVDGKWHPILARGVPIRDEHGEIIYWAGINLDISRLKEAEEGLRRWNERLEHRVQERTQELAAANRELENFTSAISHDLRAPLRAIAGYAGILREDALPRLEPEDQRYLALIEDNAKHLSTLVTDLLSFSRLTKQEINTQPIDMRPLVEDVIRGQRAADTSRQIEVVVENLPTARADRTLIRQVFENLLSNAIKYTRQQPHPCIKISAWTEGGQIVFSINDNGVGFDMQHYHKLFGVFQRLHNAEEYEGTGVGLAFAKRIIERHGGKIWAESEPDRGATFFFTLPAA